MIRKSVKDLSKAFTSVEQAVEKNQEIIHDLRRSTSNKNVSPKIKEMLEKENQRLEEQKLHESRIRTLKKRGSEIVEKRMSGSFVLGSDGSTFNMKQSLEEEAEKVRLEEEEKNRQNNENNDEEGTTTTTTSNPQVELTEKPEVVNQEDQGSNPPQPTPKHVEPELVKEPEVPKVVKQSDPQPTPKHVEPEHVPVKEEPKQEPKQHTKKNKAKKQVELDDEPVITTKPVEQRIYSNNYYPSYPDYTYDTIYRNDVFIEPKPKKVEEAPKQEEEAPKPKQQPKKQTPPKKVEEAPKQEEEAPKPKQPKQQTPPQPTTKTVEPEPVKEEPKKQAQPKPTTKHVEPEPVKEEPKRKAQPKPTTKLVEPEPVKVEEHKKPKRTVNEQPVIVKKKNVETNDENLRNMEFVKVSLMKDFDTVEINSDSDLAIFIIQSINKSFEPFWEEYMKKFDPTKFTLAGKVGWDSKEDTPRRMVAREPINKMKNIESIHLFRIPFTTRVTDMIHEKVSEKISGISRQLIRSGIRKHIRLMLQDFIYRNY